MSSALQQSNLKLAPLSCDLVLQNYQVDWEAILARSPEPFIQSVSPWLYPPAARETFQSSPSGQGLPADSARTEDPLADMTTPSMDGTASNVASSSIASSTAAGSSQAAPPTTGVRPLAPLDESVTRLHQSCPFYMSQL